VSIAVFLGGSQVLGVVPKALAKGDIIGKIIGKELQVSTMFNRMNAIYSIFLPYDIEDNVSFWLGGEGNNS
jgi:hypothetical protein